MFFSIERAESLLPRLSRRVSLLRQRFPVVGGKSPLIDEENDEVSEVMREIESLGVVAMDLGGGVLDFPALRMGVPVYLCWRVGEGRIAYWHRAGEGHAQRKAIIRSEFLRDHEIYQVLEADRPVKYELLEEGEMLSIQVDVRGRDLSGLGVCMVGRLLVVKWESCGWTYRKEIPLHLGFHYSIIEQRRHNGILLVRVKRTLTTRPALGGI